MISIEEFRTRIREDQTEYLLNEVLLAGGARHVKEDDIVNIERTLAHK